MEIKIGVQNAPRELSIDTDLDADAVQKLVDEALAGNGTVSFSDARGRRILVPADRLAYVDITTSVAGQVGFRG